MPHTSLILTCGLVLLALANPHPADSANSARAGALTSRWDRCLRKLSRNVHSDARPSQNAGSPVVAAGRVRGPSIRAMGLRGAGTAGGREEDAGGGGPDARDVASGMSRLSLGEAGDQRSPHGARSPRTASRAPRSASRTASAGSGEEGADDREAEGGEGRTVARGGLGSMARWAGEEEDEEEGDENPDAPRCCPRDKPLGLCYQCYHSRFYQFGPDSSAIGPISFVPISYQRGSRGKPLKASKAQRGLSAFVLFCQRDEFAFLQG